MRKGVATLTLKNAVGASSRTYEVRLRSGNRTLGAGTLKGRTVKVTSRRGIKRLPKGSYTLAGNFPGRTASIVLG